MHSRRRGAFVLTSLLTNTNALDVVLSERRGSGAARRWRVSDRITPLTTRRWSLIRERRDAIADAPFARGAAASAFAQHHIEGI